MKITEEIEVAESLANRVLCSGCSSPREDELASAIRALCAALRILTDTHQ